MLDMIETAVAGKMVDVLQAAERRVVLRVPASTSGAEARLAPL